MSVCMFTCVGILMYMYRCIWKSKVEVRIFLSCSLGQGLQIKLKTSWLVSKVSFLLGSNICFLRMALIDRFFVHLTLMWVLEILTLVFLLVFNLWAISLYPYVSFYEFQFILFMKYNMDYLPACMSVYHVYVWYLQRSKAIRYMKLEL